MSKQTTSLDRMGLPYSDTVESQYKNLSGYQRKKYVDTLDMLRRQGYHFSELPTPTKLNNRVPNAHRFEKVIVAAKRSGVDNPTLRKLDDIAKQPFDLHLSQKDRSKYEDLRKEYGVDTIINEKEQTGKTDKLSEMSVREKMLLALDVKLKDVKKKLSKDEQDITRSLVSKAKKTIMNIIDTRLERATLFGHISQRNTVRVEIKKLIRDTQIDDNAWIALEREFELGNIIPVDRNYSSSGDGTYNIVQFETLQNMRNFLYEYEERKKGSGFESI